MCWWQISGTFFGAYFNTAGLWTPSCNHPLYFHIEFSVLDTLTKIIRWMYTVNLERHKHSFRISPWKAGGCDGRKRFAFWDEAVTVWTVPITTSGSHLKLKHVTCCKRAAYLCQCGSWSVRTIWWSCSVFAEQFGAIAECWNEGLPAGPAPRRSALPCLQGHEALREGKPLLPRLWYLLSWVCWWRSEAVLLRQSTSSRFLHTNTVFMGALCCQLPYLLVSWVRCVAFKRHQRNGASCR